MASEMRQQQHRSRAILQLAALLLLASPAAMLVASAGACESEMLAAGMSYAACEDLPTLGATLHWTYDAAASSLSLAFAARPAATGGWVAWGINPTGDGMKGAQTLLAFKSGSTYVVNTYNLTGYAKLGAAATPIAFQATELAADESDDGKVRIYGKLQLPRGMENVNHIWQVGSVVSSGEPMKHAFGQENLEAKGTLALAGASAPVSAPAPVAGGPTSGDAGEVETQTTSSSPAPSGGKPSPSPSSADTGYASAPVLVVVLALVGFLAIV
uniref:Uncharacterized protein n=1 Tax=Avena sativa TaxID=4498 RepID=A0ACD5YDN2_AVESA